MHGCRSFGSAAPPLACAEHESASSYARRSSAVAPALTKRSRLGQLGSRLAAASFCSSASFCFASPRPEPVVLLLRCRILVPITAGACAARVKSIVLPRCRGLVLATTELSEDAVGVTGSPPPTSATDTLT